MSISEKMTAIANNIREKTGVFKPLSLDDMASGVNETFESGKKAEYNDFWDAFQNYGNRANYAQAFSNGFPDETYNPKYDIKGTCNMLFGLSKVSDSKVRILEANNILQLCRYNSEITRIVELNMMENTNIGSDNDPFLGATKLSELYMTGVLAKTIKFSSCPLNVASIKSIINCMKDYSGTENEYTYTITFRTAYFNKLEAEGTTSPNGNTWAEYIDDLKWNLALA